MTDAQRRKEQPVFTGCLMYFPRAMRAIASLSLAGNRQHHPDKPLHWDKPKSNDHADCAARHLLDSARQLPDKSVVHDVVDTDGHLHVTKHAWRALALLETTLEQVEARVGIVSLGFSCGGYEDDPDDPSENFENAPTDTADAKESA